MRTPPRKATPKRRPTPGRRSAAETAFRRIARAGARSATLSPDRATSMSEAPVLEVFASIQGEGAFVGQSQVFVRLAGCPLRCAWCDTPHSWVVDPQRPARVAALSGERSEPALVDAQRAAAWVEEVDPGGTRPVSVTGGEPLLYPAFLEDLVAALAPRPVHLETAGAHPLALGRLVSCVRHVSLDLKLPADLGAPVGVAGESETAPADARQWAAARRACLELVAPSDACAKIPVASGRSVSDFEPLLSDVASFAPRLPVVLQPVTPVPGSSAPEPALLFALVERAEACGLTARVLPQVHPLLGVE